MNLRLLRLGVVGVLIAPYAAVLAQGLSTIDFVKGNYGKYATTLKLADLPEDYSAVKLSISSSTTDPLSALWPFIGMGSHGPDPNINAKYRFSQVYWTNGDTVRASAREFLVTYKLNVDVLDIAAQNDNGGMSALNDTKPKTPEPTLKISLVALDSIQGVTPCPEMKKEELISLFGSPGRQATAPGQVAARQAEALSDVKQVALGLIMYDNDYDDFLPYTQDSKSTWYVIYPYVKSLKIFKTPNPNGGMIRFNMGISGATMSSIQSPADTVLLYESEPWPDGRRAVAYCDGHVKLVSADAWAEISKRLRPAGLKRAKKPLPTTYDAEFDKLPPHGGG
jgi:prepilin-type processing-associated H-X9-DG protein